VAVQGLLCDGGRPNACGKRNLPEVAHPTSADFLQSIDFNPKCGPDGRPLGAAPGSDAPRPEAPASAAVGSPAISGHATSLRPDLNRFTFTGSYYHVYVRTATCDPPKGR
jgi:hypothetical protein